MRLSRPTLTRPVYKFTTAAWCEIELATLPVKLPQKVINAKQHYTSVRILFFFTQYYYMLCLFYFVRFNNS